MFIGSIGTLTIKPMYFLVVKNFWNGNFKWDPVVKFRLFADSSIGIISSIVIVILVFGYTTELHAKVSRWIRVIVRLVKLPVFYVASKDKNFNFKSFLARSVEFLKLHPSPTKSAVGNRNFQTQTKLMCLYTQYTHNSM